MEITVYYEYPEFSGFVNSFSPDQVLKEFEALIVNQELFGYFIPKEKEEYKLLTQYGEVFIEGSSYVCASNNLAPQDDGVRLYESYDLIYISREEIGWIIFSKDDIERIQLAEDMMVL